MVGSFGKFECGVLRIIAALIDEVLDIELCKGIEYGLIGRWVL